MGLDNFYAYIEMKTILGFYVTWGLDNVYAYIEMKILFWYEHSYYTCVCQKNAFVLIFADKYPLSFWVILRWSNVGEEINEWFLH